MVKFCSNCGTANPRDSRFCSKCGNALGTAETAAEGVPEAAAVASPVPESIADPVEPMPDDPGKPRNVWLIAGAVAAVLLVALLYFILFVADDMGNEDGNRVSDDQSATVSAPVQMFAMTEANIRDKATTVDSNIIGKLPRGSAVTGVLKTGADGESEWFELVEGKGFIAAMNLGENEPPVLVRSLVDKLWEADTAIEIWSAPDNASTLIDRVQAGTTLTLAGLTDNDYIEIKLRKGGVGYIADGAAIVARANGKPVVIAFNPANCRFGPEIDAEFDRLSARVRAQWTELENRAFPSEDARNQALSAIEGRSTFQRLQRSYKGLTVTGIAQHYESQSLYFADPASKVIEVFRANGHRIGRDGTFPSTELYAGISGTRAEGTAYGKSELGCGV